MSYVHPNTGTIFSKYNSHKEHCFYEETTKRQMFLIIEQFSDLLKNEDQDWIDKAKEEIKILSDNSIK